MYKVGDILYCKKFNIKIKILNVGKINKNNYSYEILYLNDNAETILYSNTLKKYEFVTIIERRKDIINALVA